MQLIAAAEGERRGLYGGAVGYLGYDGNLDTAITIRSAVLKDGQAHVHTGAGIVAGSVPESEFEETEHKAAALRRAIEHGAPAVGPSTAREREPTRRGGRHDPGRRQLRQLHVQPRPGAPGGRRRGHASSATTRSTRPASKRWPTTRQRTCAGSSSRPVPAIRTTPASRSTPSRSRPTARSRSSASASGCSRWRPRSAPRSSVRRRSSTARRPRSPTTAPGSSRGCRRRSWPPATTRSRSTRRRSRRSCG